MKVRMLVDLSGPSFYHEAGSIYECDDAEATRLISARYALPYIEDKTERAVAAPIIETRDPLDHDGDGKRGGSLPKARRAPRKKAAG